MSQNRIFIIRHGETGSKKRQKPKTSIVHSGMAQAAGAGSRLPNTVGFVYSSTLTRALETAQIIAEKIGSGTAIIQSRLLDEIPVPERFYGAPWNEPVHKSFRQSRHQALRTANTKWSFDDEPTLGEFLKQVIQAKHWLEKSEDTEMAFVSHGIFIALLLALIDKGEDATTEVIFQAMQDYYIGHGKIATVAFDTVTRQWHIENIER